MRRIRRQLHRRRDLDGQPLYLMIRAASRDRPHRFLDPADVPDFEGESAWFEIEVLAGGGLRFLRRIDGPLGD
ncbi:MAG: hypothetical protein IM658_03440 [Phenylobacterium sp.]|uniref:hypothetical protein n=1 Tax=Phenylobacterium sp. TaxID=1871053 RepID=UPI0025D619EA|nr:hypothetical protein [Phenylobacterium sp.]MCA3709743.1 hypothetical protein [Phenylobacterium sp.]MCA3715392.1 hypothetical protein [Phenylobacterium sp.]MCA3730197.1 hypothetical protein [Phenylobacterium sp.]MCA3732981.1 hypothetical protein [Phenylobacterium sp.]MCA3737198.1 hypothetical protein [Phenylobacterium sp.]